MIIGYEKNGGEYIDEKTGRLMAPLKIQKKIKAEVNGEEKEKIIWKDAVYPVVDMADVKKRILTNDDIHFTKCLIKNFECRNSSKMDVGISGIRIKNFIAIDSIFEGKANFAWAEFDGEIVYFDNCYFQDEADFNLTIFNGCAPSIKNVFFLKSVSFSGAKFIANNSSVIAFDGSVFNNNVSFYDVDFGKSSVSFADICVKGEAIFTNAVFNGKSVKFDLACFNGEDTFFNSTNFGGSEVSFLNVKWGIESKKTRLYFVKTKFGNEGTDFTSSVFHKVNVHVQKTTVEGVGLNFDCIALKNSVLYFRDCNFNTRLSLNRVPEADDVTEDSENGIIYFENCFNSSFINMRNALKGIVFLRFAGMVNTGNIALDWDEYKKALNRWSDKKELDELISQYSMLKENFNGLGEYDKEDEAYIAFRRFKTMKDKSWRKKAVFFLLDLIGEYGTNPRRVMEWMIWFIVAFGIWFSNLNPITAINVNASIADWIKPFYFSLVTFFTIGYGDITPANTAAAISVGIEGFLGVFLMGFFSVALVRKILR